MNTDASNVEDINILQIIERLSISCIESSGERSNIFPNRSFTLFKNGRHLRENVVSAAVCESISSSMTNLSYSGLQVLVCCTFDELRGTFWLSHLVFTGLSDAVEAITFGSFTRYRDTKFIIVLDLAVTLSSPASSCVPFDITSRQLMELKWLTLNKHKKMIPFITCEISICQYVCELVLGVNEFDLNLGVQIDPSNNQSRATLWVLETCRIVGLLPFMIILITASLSSKMYNIASLREEFA